MMTLKAQVQYVLPILPGTWPHPYSQQGALAALDMLSVSGLINYMGKVDLPLNAADAQQSGIAIKPVLLRKGNTRTGMYGVGNIKDQRMHFELRSNRVRMFMPKDKDDWFNVLILHQNRWVPSTRGISILIVM